MGSKFESDSFRRWFWVWALIAVITAASAAPAAPVAPDATRLIPHFDKVVHFFVFGLLATLALRAFSPASRRWLGAAVAIALTSAFGLADEFHQSTNPVRHFSWFDWVADTVGGLVAVGAYLGWPAYRRTLEWPLFRADRETREIAAECDGTHGAAAFEAKRR